MMTIKVTTKFPRSRPRKLDGDAGWLNVPAEAVFEDERLRLTVVVDVVDGRPFCPSYKVERHDGGGLELMTTEVLRGINLRDLMANVCARIVVVPHGKGFAHGGASVAAIHAAVGTVGRRRASITDERLREFAAAFEERFERGRMPEFAKSLGCSERQGWRLKKLAQERGFLLQKEGT